MIYELGRLAVGNLLRARSRLVMTVGGVLVGTTAVVLLIAMTIGLQQAAEMGIGSSASLTDLEVFPAWGNGPQSSENVPQLTVEAVRAFWRLPGVAAVIPMVNFYYGGELLAGDYSGYGQIIGLDPDLLPYLGLSAAQGEISLARGEVVVGALVGQNFHDPRDAEWQPVEVDTFSTPLRMRSFSRLGEERSTSLSVSAVLQPINWRFDYSVIMPIEDVMRLNGWASGEKIDLTTFTFDQVIVRATSRETVVSVSQAVQDMGYGVGGDATFLDQLNSFFGTMRVMLGAVGGVALLVAAFGVANTMTMSILERTSEIGLMKAVGATDQNVLTIFLIEAGLVGLSGGAAGVLLSLLIQDLVNRALQNMPTDGSGVMFLPLDPNQLQAGGGLLIIPLELVLFALVLATGVGLGAGLFPSLRAARLQPVIALKTE